MRQHALRHHFLARQHAFMSLKQAKTLMHANSLFKKETPALPCRQIHGL